MCDRRDIVVYVAGPFRAPTHWGVVRNVRRAEELSLAVWAAGYTPICPHLNTANYQGALPDEVWLSGDMRIIERCDAVLLLPGWENSVGTKAEKTFADNLRIPVFQSLSDLGEWYQKNYSA